MRLSDFFDKVFGKKLLTIQCLSKEISILADKESADRGTEDLDVQTVKDSHLVELNTTVQGSLTAKGQEDSIGSLTLNNVFEVLGGDREEVDSVSKSVRGLDRSNVRVNENSLDVGFLQCFDRLGA